MPILYSHPYSQHARRVMSLLEEADLDYIKRVVALEQGENLSHEYRALNPNCQVPTLVDGDITLYESNAIMRYLCLKHSLHTWYPEALPQRARVEQWLDWNQCRLGPAVLDIVLNKVFMGDQGDATAIERGQNNLQALVPILDAALATQAFIAGEHPTIADLSLASNIFQLSLADITPPGKHLTRWYQQISALRGFQQSLPTQTADA